MPNVEVMNSDKAGKCRPRKDEDIYNYQSVSLDLYSKHAIGGERNVNQSVNKVVIRVHENA